MQTLSNIFWLGLKELQSFLRDYVLLGLVIYTFSFAIYLQGHSNAQELYNASIGVVDEDNSALSRRMMAAFLPPYFQKPKPVAAQDVDHLMNTAAFTFVIVIPPHFETDVLAGRIPAVQVNVDATAMVTAGLGYGYIQQILTTEINNFVSRNEGQFQSRSQDIGNHPLLWPCGSLSIQTFRQPGSPASWVL